MKNGEKKTLYLVDGTALTYRSYFAFIRNPLINSRGEDTSAAFGFTSTLVKLIREHEPDCLAVVFDTGKPTFRHEMYGEYKATRQKMPADMIEQLPRVREAVDALGIVSLEVEGFEADDVIGTLAVGGAKEGFDVFMVTGDKDFMQLVGESIRMYVPGKEMVVGADEVKEQFGVPPERIIDLLGLMGDASD
ncbi:MAG: DNA polymerase I, partial [Candidatus Latescibacteria bacterium]|nr:DNA polymerase I [Candidatus Latescibacterota bacterium]